MPLRQLHHCCWPERRVLHSERLPSRRHHNWCNRHQLQHHHSKVRAHSKALARNRSAREHSKMAQEHSSLTRDVPSAWQASRRRNPFGRDRRRNHSHGDRPTIHHRTSLRAALKTIRRHSGLRQLFRSLQVPHQLKARTRLSRSPQSDSSKSPKSSECLVRSEFAHLGLTSPFPGAPHFVEPLATSPKHCSTKCDPQNKQDRKTALCLRIT